MSYDETNRIEMPKSFRNIWRCNRITTKMHLPKYTATHLGKLENEFIYYCKCGTCGIGRICCIICAELGGKHHEATYDVILRKHHLSFSHDSHVEIWIHLIRHSVYAGIISNRPRVMEYICTGHDQEYEAAHINRDDLLRRNPQLLFINQVDMEANSHTVMENIENNAEGEFECSMIRTNSAYPTEQERFRNWFDKFMLACNYECIVCGVMYEDGMPSVEIVFTHVHPCIVNVEKQRLLDSNH